MANNRWWVLVASFLGMACGPGPILGTALCGLGIGAEVDLMASFISRYLGVKAYGKVHGVSFAIFVIGNGLGSLVAGFSFDEFHSYTPAFFFFAGALVVTCALLLPLGRYPFPAQPHPARLTEAEEATAA